MSSLDPQGARDLGAMELRIVREIQEVKDLIVPEARVRELAREEMGMAARAAWTTRSAIAAVGVLFVSISTFIYTLVQHTGGTLRGR